ncbi:MAG: DUF4366 domain-containing protein [Butyrivibrio sp.]|nr:DUF4366 domain-containing protein [Butyrivibrio sp.]
MKKFQEIKRFMFALTLAFALALGFAPLSAWATEAEPATEGTEGEETAEEEPQEVTPTTADYVINLPVAPNVYLTIFTEYEWYNSQYAIAHVVISDIANTGEFEVQSVRARIGSKGNWFDITQDQQMVLSENGSVYISITDTNGNIYEKSVNITCFDYEKPYLNAAISDGTLKVQPYDSLSGIHAVYINGYAFLADTFVRGNLSVRLQQFDASFPYFAVQALDNAGNTSDVYTFVNPYYVAPDAETDENPGAYLPINAMPSAPTEAVGEVTEHMETDAAGNSIEPVYTSETGKSFYTIQTENGKVFYLVINRDGNQENVYFLTEISENDLLNATNDTSQTMPQNSTATGNTYGMLPDIVTAPEVSGAAISQEQVEAMNPESDDSAAEPAGDQDAEQTASEDAVSDNSAGSGESGAMGNILIGVGAVIFIVVAYFVKIKKPKGKKQTDEAIEDEEDDEIEEEDDE